MKRCTVRLVLRPCVNRLFPLYFGRLLVCIRTNLALRVQVGHAAEETPAWSVLKDDFMMGASMKDWDKESEEETAEAQGGPGDYSSDSD